MIALRRSASRSASARFKPMPLVAVLLSLIGRRAPRRCAAPDPEWERDEPMTGLS
ncbi:hypothetical protein [Uliginosibacterium flavum]|uniref:Uncharacterized protein n=1 Tax=Uliginosibacterium flavum TaxID=1396831 RepID=A0ABV2TQK0_9RHOO